MSNVYRKKVAHIGHMLLAASMMTACGGSDGGSSAPSSGGSINTPNPNRFNTSFSSTLTLETFGSPSRVANRSTTMNDENAAFSVIKNADSTTDVFSFNLNVPATSRASARNITVSYDTVTQQPFAVSFYDDTSDTVYGCGTGDQRRCSDIQVRSYNKNTGQVSINFNNAALDGPIYEETEQGAFSEVARLNGNLTGSMVATPLQVQQLTKTSTDSLTVNGRTVRAQAIRVDQNADSAFSEITLENGDSLTVLVDQDSNGVELATTSLLSSSGFFFGERNVQITQNTANRLAIRFNNVVLNPLFSSSNTNATVSGQYTVNKPQANNVRLNGALLEATNSQPALVEHSEIIINQLQLKLFRLTHPTTGAETDVTVALEGNQVYFVDLRQTDANDFASAPRSCGVNFSPCTGITVSSNLDTVQFNETTLRNAAFGGAVQLSGSLTGYAR